MSSVLVRLRSAARSGAPAQRAGQVPPAVVQLPAGVAAAAVDPDHWHAGDPRWASQLAVVRVLTGAAPGSAAAPPGVPAPRHTPEDARIDLPTDRVPQLVGVGNRAPAAAPPPEPSRTASRTASRVPSSPDPSTWFS